MREPQGRCAYQVVGAATGGVATKEDHVAGPERSRGLFSGRGGSPICVGLEPLPGV